MLIPAPALILVAQIALALNPAAADKAPETAAVKQEAPVSERVFEMRTYYTHPGRIDALNKRFREHTCTLFKKHGIEIVGFWTPTEESKRETLVYLLAYPSRAAADASWKAFRDDPEWKAAAAESEKDGKIVAKVDSVFLNPTDYSPIK